MQQMSRWKEVIRSGGEDSNWPSSSRKGKTIEGRTEKEEQQARRRYFWPPGTDSTQVKRVHAAGHPAHFTGEDSREGELTDEFEGKER